MVRESSGRRPARAGSSGSRSTSRSTSRSGARLLRCTQSGKRREVRPCRAAYMGEQSARAQWRCAVQRLTFTVTESAEILGISRTTAYELVRSGALPCVRLGRRIVITRRTLEELLGTGAPASASARRRSCDQAAGVCILCVWHAGTSASPMNSTIRLASPSSTSPRSRSAPLPTSSIVASGWQYSTPGSTSSTRPTAHRRRRPARMPSGGSPPRPR